MSAITGKAAYLKAWMDRELKKALGG